VFWYCWAVLFIVKTFLKIAGKKRKSDIDNRGFKDKWTKDYFFIENNGKSLCLICMDTIAVAKVNNIKQHHNSKHPLQFDFLQGEERVKKASEFKKKLSSQQSIFVKTD